MMHKKFFGTDGIRGLAGEFPLNSPALEAIGQAIGERLGKSILVGEDTRLSSPWIRTQLEIGIARTTARIENAGIIPTPAIALLTQKHDFAGGVMISASHNPFEDNGIKIFGPDGRKLSDLDESILEQRITEILGDGTDVDAATEIPEQPVAGNSTSWAERYEQLLVDHFPDGPWLQGVRIVVDCANGAMTSVAPHLLRRLGAQVTAIHDAPTGRNINDGCGAVHLESLQRAMQTQKADFGVAFDGDGDRSLFVSGSGRVIDGDAVLLMMARRLKHQGLLVPAGVIGTSMTNYSLERMLDKEGIALIRVAVGDRYIFEEMQRSGAVLGGEPSGHVIFPDFQLSGDGLLTTLKVAQAVVEAQASFDDLTHDWTPAPQLLTGVRVKQRVPLDTVPAIQAKIGEIAHTLHGRGRIVVRYSGTEPLLRVMIESDDAGCNERLVADMISTIHTHLL